MLSIKQVCIPFLGLKLLISLTFQQGIINVLTVIPEWRQIFTTLTWSLPLKLQLAAIIATFSIEMIILSAWNNFSGFLVDWKSFISISRSAN